MDRIVHFTKAYHNTTTLHPVGGLMFAFAAILLLTVPRRFTLLPIFGLVCLVATAQRVVLGGIDFDLLRLTILTGIFRVFWRGEFSAFRWKLIDVAVVTWWAVGAIAYIALHSDWLDSSVSGLSGQTRNVIVYQAGLFLDHVGLYFLFRLLIRNWEEVESAARCLMMISIPVAVAFLIEKSTGRNFFSMFGGVPEQTLIRGDRLRCQGPFAHPIIAGVFFATMLPLIVVQWWNPKRSDRRLIVCGIASFFAIIFACSSSTPVMAVLFSMFAAGMLLFRRYLGFFRWGTLASLVFLHFAMEKPAWHLIARVNFLGGTGWHRFHLIDEWINHTHEWWLSGVKGTAHWGWGLSDITNEYILHAVNGGIWQLAAFVWLLALCYQGVGRRWRLAGRDRYQLYVSWALGCSLFAHTMSFISVSYFGQAKVVWFFTLAAIASLAPAPILTFKRVYSPKIKTKQIDPYAIYAPSGDRRVSPTSGRDPSLVE